LARDRLLFGAAFLTLSAGCCWPILSSAYVPLVDFPVHASQIALWRAYSGSVELQQLYTLHFASPCAVFYILWRVLVSLGLGIEPAGKLLVCACLIAVPACLAVILRVRGRPVIWALMAFPLVFTQQFAWGFLPFYFAFAGLFLGLAVFSVWLERRKLPWAIAVAVSGVVVLWSHALTGGFWGLACGLLALLHPGSVRQRIVSLWPLLLPGVILAVWASHESGHGTNIAFGSATPCQRATIFFDSVSGGTTPQVTMAAGLTRIAAVVVLIAGLAEIASSRQVRGSSFVRQLAQGLDVPLLATAAVAFVLYLAMPLTLFQSDLVYLRFAPMAYLLTIAALPAVSRESVRRGVAAMAMVCALVVDVAVTRAYAEFNRKVGDAHALFASLPAGASAALPKGAARGLAPLELRVFDNFAVWAQVATLGRASSFTRFPQMLVQDATPQPDPLFDATLARYQTGEPAIASAAGRLPDVLVFFTPDPPAPQLPVAGGPGVYRLTQRTGGLNAFTLER
jgi:hypothetical protein